MKFNTVIKLSAVAVGLSLSVVGCRKGLEKTTPLPGRGAATPPTADATGPLIGGNNNNTTGLPLDTGAKPVPIAPTVIPEGGVGLNPNLTAMVPSAEQPFAHDTVYFDYDKAILKQSEIPKVERVASGMKGRAGKALRIEGHCDERGTEEYNRSLGERRALAVRESLIRAGMDANLIDTISFGEDRPADPGHDQAAYAKNRRGEFILIEPPSATTTSNGK
jgi:outer membrane protein OmpA-like peptidoglycan-associated protein